MGSVLLVSGVMAIANLIVDISYRWLDPRVVYD
jgi:ABC-type dipeptide/oligopeptide/nickel transport system permease component